MGFGDDSWNLLCDKDASNELAVNFDFQPWESKGIADTFASGALQTLPGVEYGTSDVSLDRLQHQFESSSTM